ncbi:MAG: hypothetical protein ABI742_09505, partial [Gemmatimonadota bacterium]
GGLSRWIGTDGYGVLLDRALEVAGAEHEGKGGLHFLTDGEKAIVAAIRVNGVAKVTRGFVAVVAAIIHLLSEVVGVEMAIRLVEQAWTSSTHGSSGSNTQGVRNG